jgi:hypothetical protein
MSYGAHPRAVAPLLSLILGLVAALALVAPASATVAVPLDDADLASDAVIVMVGRVTAIESHWDPARARIFTDIRLAVDEVIAGDVSTSEVTVRQAGGRVGGVENWIEGSPTFHRGERVLVFLAERADGTLRIAHLYQGKFSIQHDAVTGDDFAVRDDTPPGVKLFGTRQAAGGPRKLGEFRSWLRRVPRRPGRGAAPITTPKVAVGAVTQEQESFTFLGTPSRWFEPDSGQAVGIFMNEAGEPRAPGRGFDQVRAGYEAWNRAPGSAFRFRDAGFTTAAGFRYDGVSTVSFGDPDGNIDPPSGCRGTLAIGGYYRGYEQRTVNGTVFAQIIEGDLVFADGWGGCLYYELFDNLAEVATHELGHVLGLGHSRDSRATMYPTVHFDGRGAGLQADDIAAVAYMYPSGTSSSELMLSVTRAGTGSGTVASAPAGITCGSDCGQSFASGTVVTLTAMPASGSSFAGWSGGGCSGTGACTVTMAASATVTATFTSTARPSVKFLEPAGGSTIRDTVTVRMAASGGSGTGYTYRVTVDGAPVYVGTAASFSWNTTATADGKRKLAVTVTDSAGRTSSVNDRSVNVANTITGPLVVRITQPAKNAVLSGRAQVTVSLEGTTGTSNTFTVILGRVPVASLTTASRGPIAIGFDTTAVEDGSRSLKVKAVDSAARTAAVSVSVLVDNQP